ncbi:hypothetical protein [Nocardia uniformis]|uniref:hypothetical protein n=1 Tax=Nocardia uniformis TaxID=53432 RepID=UPI000B2A77E4|nr:hypothetical protein [Nocardia uniformis]
MVVSPGEAMHRIFRHDPGVFARAFNALRLPLADPTEVVLLRIGTDDPRARDRRVDALFRITTKDGGFLLLVESLAWDDSDRPAAWARDLAQLSFEYRLPPVLLVICRDRVTAMWAMNTAAVGLPLWPSVEVHPLVVGPHNVPIVMDPDAATANIPLATLSAIAHARAPQIDAILKALAAGLARVDIDDARVFAELTHLGLAGSAAAEVWSRTKSAGFGRAWSATR